MIDFTCGRRLLVRLSAQDGEPVVGGGDGAELGPRLLQLGAAAPLARTPAAAIQPKKFVFAVLNSQSLPFVVQGDPSCWWKPPVDLDLGCSAILLGL